MDNNIILSVKDLQVKFKVRDRELTAIRHISLDIEEGKVLAIVGESGSGKSVFTKTFTGMLESNGRVSNGEIWFEDKNLMELTSDKDWEKIRGKKIATIFQDPMTSLNPVRTIGYQISEVIIKHQGKSKKEAKAMAIELMHRVGIHDPEKRYDEYPFMYSGGMRQRIVIAIALACRPKILICDEPTTALDVTIQAQIIELLLELQQKENMALVLITHDLALVAEAAHKIIVMYAGQVVETGDAHAIFHAPRHPYTQALLRALPEFAQDKERLASLPGVVPGKYDRPNGCLLNPRCPYATDRCRAEEPALNMLADGRQSKCHYPLDDAGRPTL